MDFSLSWLDFDEAQYSLWWLGIALALAIAQYALRRFAERKHDSLWIQPVRATLRPFFLIVCLLLVRSALHIAPWEALHVLLAQVVNVALVASVAWWILAAARAMKSTALRRFDVTVEDNYHARQVHTRIGVLYRIFCFAVVLVAIASALMTFEAVRAIGAGLLAGAGVTGIILGFAAQKTIGSIFAGIQIAITQPIKVDDAVVIEGEWGWIEEITLTYVVVKIWDWRRLIVPITYFVENPIQNWTRREAEIIGSVILYTDYTVRLEPLRAELTRLLESNPLWSKKVNVLQVVDATEHALQLRALVSARNSPQAWDLRCAVREGLISYLQREQPEALPRTRVELGPEEALKPATGEA